MTRKNKVVVINNPSSKLIKVVEILKTRQDNRTESLLNGFKEVSDDELKANRCSAYKYIM